MMRRCGIAGAMLCILLCAGTLLCGCGSVAPTLPSPEPPAGGGGGFDLPPAEDGKPDITGSALNEQGVSPGPVRVNTTDGVQMWEDEADRSGGYALRDVSPGLRAVSFALPGHETLWELVSVEAADVRLDVTMQEIDTPSPTTCPVITMNRIGMDEQAGTATVSGTVEHLDGPSVALLHNGQAQLVGLAVLPAAKVDGGFTGYFEAVVQLVEGVNRFVVMASNAACTVLSQPLSVSYLPVFGIGGNNPPVIRSLTTDQIGVGQRGVANLTCDAYDRDGNPLTYEWRATGGSIGGNQATAVWGSAAEPGWYTVFCTVSDSRGGAATASIHLRTLGGPNTPPVIDSLTANPTQAGQRGVSEITCVAHDEDGDPLFYSWSATGGRIGGDEPTATWITEPTPGLYTITVSVTDGADTVTADVQVEVI